MEQMISILLLTTTVLFFRMNYYKKNYEIYYNNYIQCLNVLKEYDPKLKAYLESKEEQND